MLVLLLIACQSPAPSSTAAPAVFVDTEIPDETVSVEIAVEDPCASPCPLEARGAPAGARLRWSADGVEIGLVSVGEALLYTVSARGPVALTLQVEEADGRAVASASRSVVIEPATVEIAAPAVCESPCTFHARSPGAIAAVSWWADGYLLGQGEAGSDYALTYDFTTLGDRQIAAQALDASGAVLAEDSVTVRVLEGPVALRDASTCVDPCTFTVDAVETVARVAYAADGWALGDGDVAAEGFPLTYDFSTLGARAITATAYDDAGVILGVDEQTVTVLSGEDPGPSTLPDVPYFYQYDNSLYPGSTCQNTSVAMLLAFYGWSGTPDDITADWGKDYAQSPANLATLFNTLAADSGITARLTAHTDGEMADLEALLDAGLPVIVHGYFTSAGHVLLILGADAETVTVNDPAGTWAETFMGGYPYASDTSTTGDHIVYDRGAFEAAIATWDGSAAAPIWYHALR